MNAKQKTVIAIALAAVVAMGLYPPWKFCWLQYGWLLSPLERDEHCFGSTFELATGRLLLQWGFVIALAAALVLAFKGPKALEGLKDYHGAKFNFTKYLAPGEDWKYDHCAGCWAKFAEHDGPGILHEGYVTAVSYEGPLDQSDDIIECDAQSPSINGGALIFVCARCFNQCRDTLDFKLESLSA
jgi:hypothetical protein